MSSPMPYPGSVTASTPDVGSSSQDGGRTDLSGVSLRPMRLKVLYTFDDENKTNCLARWPHVLHVQTVQLDETSTIGVIELKTCIRAIVSASPELVAKLGQDYTVYAYDYSEYETPLVGQGMLSWALASASPTPGAPAHQSRTMITGRVCKNILGLFSNGVRETLEVKLRLVSVPTCLQSEYLSSMEKYRELSKVMPAGFDAGAWTAFLQANPKLGELVSGSTTPTSNGANPATDGAGMELLRHLLDQGLLPDHVIDSLCRSKDQGRFTSERQPVTTPGDVTSRAPSPTRSIASEMAPSLTTSEQCPPPPSRPMSRASATEVTVLNQSQPSASVQDSVEREDLGNNADHEDEPVKKRARVVKANWNGKSTLESSAESLRVAASTAASVRVYRPIAINPALSGTASIDAPARAPTPRPDRTQHHHRRSLTAGRSALGRDSSDEANASSRVPAPLSLKDVHQSIESAATSPEDGRNGSATNTPIHIASSPPVVDDAMSPPSSPVLPTLPHIDSGFMSGTVDDLFEENDEMRPLDKDHLEVAAQYSERRPNLHVTELSIENVTPGPPELLPTRILPRPPLGIRPAVKRSRSVASSEAGGSPEDSAALPAPKARKERKTRAPSKPRPIAQSAAAPPAAARPMSQTPEPQPPSRPSRTLTRTPSIGNMTLPPVTTSDPLLPPSNLQRCQTTSGAEHAKSDAPTAAAVMSSAARMPAAVQPKVVRNGSGVKRRNAIQKRLESAIESGEMPPYCENCGAIETPTWRKTFTKVLCGTTHELKAFEADAGILSVKEIESERTDEGTSFMIMRKSLLPADEGFKEVQLCNPCGLWLHKFKSMRPEEKWRKEPKDVKDSKLLAEKRKRPSRKKGLESESKSTSRRASASQDDAPRTDVGGGALQEEDTEDDIRDLPQTKRVRASSVQAAKCAGMDNVDAAAALDRAIKSSPIRLRGHLSNVMDVEKLGTTRRLLFPSPTKAGGQPPGNDMPSIKAQSPTPAPMESFKSKACIGDCSDKENRPPATIDGQGNVWGLCEDDAPRTPASRSATRFSFATPTKLASSKKSTRYISPQKTQVFSSTGKDHLLPPRTPSTRDRSPKAAPGTVEQSPFTAQLRALFSGTDMSPSANPFDLGALPSLEDMIPTETNAGHDSAFHLSEFHPDDVFSTDIPMPSSPPAFFSLYEDPAEPTSGLWSEYNMPEGMSDMPPPTSEVGLETFKTGPGYDASTNVPLAETGEGLGRGGKMGDTKHSTLTVDFTALIGDMSSDRTSQDHTSAVAGQAAKT